MAGDAVDIITDAGGCWDAEERQGPAPPLLLVAAAALIDIDGRVLIAQRPEGRSMAGRTNGGT